MNSLTNRSVVQSTLTLLIALCWSGFALAQQKQMKGTLRDPENKPVAHASVRLLGPSDRLISFRVSDTQGNFSLILPDSLKVDQLRLEVNHLGYQNVKQDLVPGRVEYPIVLVPQTINLAQVQVKSRPRISVEGDTLLYDIGSFAKGEDRSIGDVIKRLPGMEVDENGLIKFNGKSISHLYIDGDDLLAQRYAVGIRAIPHSMVKGLEVLQNHQERKVLKDKVLSDQVALNLVIKDDAKLKLSGNGKIAAGLPAEMDLEANTILFNKRYKMLNAVNANNVGRDLAVPHGAAGLLGTGTVSSPNLPKSRYFLNRSASLNANHLVTTKKDFQWKTSADLVVDRNKFRYQNRTDMYIGGDTIRYDEFQNTRSEPLGVALSLQGRLNKDRYFFNNETKLRYTDDKHLASLAGSQTQINQSLRNRVKNFSNNLEYIPASAGGNILSFRWQVDYQISPQELAIEPGLHAEELNQGQPFSAILQYADMPGWQTEASLAYRLTKRKVSKNFSAGIRLESQDLNSSLRTRQSNGVLNDLQGSFGNGLRWRSGEYAVAASLESKTKALEWVLNLPLSLQHLRYYDRGFRLDESAVNLLFQPGARIKYKAGPENYVELNYDFKRETGTLTDLFRGAILRNYRSLYANEAGLLDQSRHNLALSYHYRKTLQMLFLNAGINLNRSSASHVASYRVDGQISRILQLPFENNAGRFSVHAGISKYIFGLGATASMKVTWSTGRVNQFFNESLLPYRNAALTISPEFEMRLMERISVSYRADGRFQSSRAFRSPKEKDGARVYQFDESLGLTLTSSSGLMIRASGRHILTAESDARSKHFMFADVFLRYRLGRWQSDIELEVNNIANVTTYERVSLSANRYTQDQYQLRGRMFLLRYSFNF